LGSLLGHIHGWLSLKKNFLFCASRNKRAKVCVKQQTQVIQGKQ